jgi:hypothetical protein
MRIAFCLGREALPKYFSKFSRHDFTVPQLFACLVVKEHQRKSYREAEALLRDSRPWCRDIGMRKFPDHNTLCRAFHALNLNRRSGKLLDRLVQWFAIAKQLGSIVAIDSTLYDTHHRSRHYEQRCRHYASRRNRSADAQRSRSARRAPKLSVAVCTRSHLILSARTRTGMGSDAPDFDPLLFHAWRRHPRLRVVLADAGYDSEANHCIARLDMHERALADQNRHRPAEQKAAERILSTNDEKTAEGIATRQNLRTACSGGNGQQHAEAQRRRRLACSQSQGAQGRADVAGTDT